MLRAIGLLVTRLSDQPGQAVYSFADLRSQGVIGSIVISDTDGSTMVATVSNLAPGNEDRITTALRDFLGNVREGISAGIALREAARKS